MSAQLTKYDVAAIFWKMHSLPTSLFHRCNTGFLRVCAPMVDGYIINVSEFPKVRACWRYAFQNSLDKNSFLITLQGELIDNKQN